MLGPLVAISHALAVAADFHSHDNIIWAQTRRHSKSRPPTQPRPIHTASRCLSLVR
jgi:hypothetical protein